MTTGKLTTRRREFLTALVCLDTSLVVAVVQGRDKGSATTLLAEHAPDAEVVACDLFSGFKSAADTLEGAVVVADVFHLVRLGLTALDEVRRRRQQQIHGHRGHKTDPLFRLRRVLRVGQERLDEAVVAKIFDRLRDADTDDEVAAAWVAVDLLRKMYAAPDRDTAHRRLVAFYEWAATVEVAEVTRLATTIDTWQDEVLAFFDTRASNAATESANVKIKSIRRPPGASATRTTTQPASDSTPASRVGCRPPRGSGPTASPPRRDPLQWGRPPSSLRGASAARADGRTRAGCCRQAGAVRFVEP
jgi:transposase